MKPITALVVFGSLLLAGCQYDPWANGFLTANVAEKDVVGTYVIDADSQKRAIRIPLSKSTLPVNHWARIVLSNDHSAEFISVPEHYRGDQVCSVTGQGSWRLGKNDSFTVVRAIIVNDDPASSCKGEIGYELNLYGRKPPYKLHITIGDPDAGDAVQFEKRH